MRVSERLAHVITRRTPTASIRSIIRPETGYFLQSLISHQRHGFLWQKLRMPRSFDYEATQDQALRRAAADAEVPVQRRSSAKR